MTESTDRVGAPSDAPTVEELLRERISSAIGGWRGALDAALPTLGFVIAWTATADLRGSVIVAGAAVVALAVVRQWRGQTQRFVIGAAVAVAIAAFFALRSGRAQDAFLPGMLTTAAVGLLYLVSNAIRWPVFGFVMALGDPEIVEASQRLRDGRGAAAGERNDQVEHDEQAVLDALTAWRADAGIVRVAARLGWVMFTLQAVKLAVQVPLYLTDNVTALGVSKVVLGWPAYLVVVLVIGLILARGNTPLAPRS